jgi:hypothetical protein
MLCINLATQRLPDKLSDKQRERKNERDFSFKFEFEQLIFDLLDYHPAKIFNKRWK